MSAHGRDQPLPQGANYQLRLSTLQNAMQEFQQNPALQRAVQKNPLVVKVLENRATYYQRQMQQLKTAQIRRMQVSKTSATKAPAATEPMGLLGQPGGEAATQAAGY